MPFGYGRLKGNEVRILNSPAAVIPHYICSHDVTEPSLAWEGVKYDGKVRRPAVPTIKDSALEDWSCLKMTMPISWIWCVKDFLRR